MTDIGTLGGGLSFPSGINNSGQVIGQSDTTGGAARLAFLYSNGQITSLSLGGNFSRPLTLTDDGLVLGDSDTTGTDPQTNSPIRHAFLYDANGMHELSLGGGDSDAYGINSSGEVIGRSYTVNGVSHAFLYSNGTLNDLGTLGGPNSSADNFAPSGKITGSSQTVLVDGFENVFHSHGFLYSGGQMIDVSVGYTESESYILTVNDSDQILGFEFNADGNQCAFVYDGTGAHELLLGGSLSYPGNINDAGQAVGSADISNETYHAFVYDDGLTLDLNDLIPNDSGWELTSGDDINDDGLILGTGNSLNGEYRAFLLTPASTSTPTPTPTPTP